ncbi:hypothetical protein ANN_09701 [Periplaneta americana]|uniref:Per a allergen n=1 Tax=Periplaneta americana TaxID=6978 RepID=A0ABQ8TPB2_PERAM|nr:hypothetical protein ANN_09701 [Periplaneta americana]
MDLRDVGYDARNWINLAQDRDKCRAYVRAAMNFRVLYKLFIIEGLDEEDAACISEAKIAVMNPKIAADLAFI